VQEEDAPEPYLPTAALSAAPPALAAEQGALDGLAALLPRAERPVLLAGRGAMHAIDALEALAEATGALLATTIPARGAFAGHSQDAGVMGGLAEPALREALGTADLVLAFGASLNRFTLDFGTLVPRARRALVTDRPPERAFPMPVEPLVLGDARDAAERLCAALDTAPTRGHGGGRDGWDLQAVQAARRDPLAGVPTLRGDLFDPRAVVRAVDACFPADRTEVVGLGHFGGWPGLYGRLGRGGLYLGPWEFGSIGVGVPTAVGAALARPDRPPLAWEGDGSLFWSLGELDTLARSGARVTVLAMDDGAYGAEVWKLDKLGVSSAGAQFRRRDLAAAAMALGVAGHAPRDADQLDAALAAALEARGPSLIHLPVDPAVRQEVF